MKIQGKTLLVTGGGSGIGRALVLNLLSRGANVAAVDVHDATIQETKQLAGTFSKNLSIHVVNITDTHAVAQLPQKIIETHGSIDGIINNAGIIQPFQKVNDLSMESIQKVMDVNFYGMLYVTKSFLPHLLERPDAHIVNISSMGGFLPVPGQTVYGASKAAVKLFTEGLAFRVTRNVGSNHRGISWSRSNQHYPKLRTRNSSSKQQRFQKIQNALS